MCVWPPYMQTLPFTTWKWKEDIYKCWIKHKQMCRFCDILQSNIWTPSQAKQNRSFVSRLIYKTVISTTVIFRCSNLASATNFWLLEGKQRKIMTAWSATLFCKRIQMRSPNAVFGLVSLCLFGKSSHQGWQTVSSLKTFELFWCDAQVYVHACGPCAAPPRKSNEAINEHSLLEMKFATFQRYPFLFVCMLIRGSLRRRRAPDWISPFPLTFDRHLIWN